MNIQDYFMQTQRMYGLGAMQIKYDEDANGRLVYIGFAPKAVSTASALWWINKITYFDSGNPASGVLCTGGTPSNATDVKVYQGSTLVSDVKLDLSARTNPSTQAYLFGTPVSMTANTDYDFVFTGMPSATTTFGYVSTNSGSADVLAATFSGESYVEGTTPGSYTATANAAGGITLLFDSFVASAGGTSARISIGQ